MTHRALDVPAILTLLPSAPTRIHLLVYRGVELEVRRWLEDTYVVTALTREAARQALGRLHLWARRARGQTPSGSTPGTNADRSSSAMTLKDVIEDAIQEAFFQLSARDDHFLWLVTWEMVNRAARRRFRLHGSDAHGPEQEVALAACAEVMGAKDCGRSVLRTYLAGHDQGTGATPSQKPGSSFWKYLNTSIDRAIVDQQRKRRRSNEFWRTATPLDTPEGPRRLPRDGHTEAAPDGFMQIARKERRQDIKRLIARIENEALQKRASKRREIILAWLEWLGNSGPNRARSMKALAQQLGVSPIHLRGTIHAFRKELREEFGEDLQLLLTSTTIGSEPYR